MATDHIVTAPFRLAFPEVFQAKAAVAGGREKFSITMLFPKNKVPLIPQLPGDGILPIRKLLFAAMQETWGPDPTKWPPKIRAIDVANYVSPTGQDGWPIRDGDLVEWDGFAGCLFVRATSQYPLGIVEGNPLHDVVDKNAVFGGLICRAQVNAFSFNNAGNVGVSLGVSNLHILKNDGTMYGGRQNAVDVFDAYAEPGTPGAPSNDPFGAATGGTPVGAGAAQTGAPYNPFV